MASKDKIIQRILKTAGIPNLLTVLSERLSPTDLQSLLLEVYHRRAQNYTPARVLADHENDRFVVAAPVSPERLNTWERHAYKALPEDFDCLLLSPVCPLGTCSVVAGIDQYRVIPTARNNEVVSDPTNVLAMEAARRRKLLLGKDPKSATAVHLATAHRAVRAQKFDDPRFFSHFSLFTLCSTARDQGSKRFELQTLRQQLNVYIRALRAFLGKEIPIRIEITDFSASIPEKHMVDHLLKPLRDEHRDLICDLDPDRIQARGYYCDLCFKLYVKDHENQWIEIGDGGSVDWTQKLLGNAKERCIISGLGSERICMFT